MRRRHLAAVLQRADTIWAGLDALMEDPLLDWLVAHPTHPKADAALGPARKAKRADVRKAAAALAHAMGCWNVLEALAHEDPDKGVRQRAGRFLTHRDGAQSPQGQRDLFG